MKRLLPILLIGGGAATAAAAWWGFKKSGDMENELTKAISGETTVSGGVFNVHATGYWPMQENLDAAARKMEGAPVDRKGRPLHTIEDYLSGKSDFVSLAGDPNIFPYGQKLIVNWNGKKIVGRVVDTGSHFHGTNKVYRIMGEEPIDFCVQSSKTYVPKKGVTAQIVAGDNFESGKAVATAGMKGQTVVVGESYSLREIVERAVEAAPVRRSKT